MSTENKKKKNKRKQANFYIVFIVTMGLFAAIRPFLFVDCMYVTIRREYEPKAVQCMSYWAMM